MPPGDATGARAVLSIEWSRVGGDDCLRIVGWSDDALTQLRQADPERIAQRIAVYPTESVAVGGAQQAAVRGSRLPSTAGRYIVDADAVSFVPQFPFVDATSYTVLVDPVLLDDQSKNGALADVADFEPITIVHPAPARTSSTSVVALYPSTPAIPRNLLRLYVHFSAPMTEGEAAARIHVRRADTGERLADAFLDFDPELWDPTRRRLTVLFDPARIKQGLAPHQEAGYPLVEGSDIEVVVDAEYRDSFGRPLVSDHLKRYAVGPDVRGRVTPECWTAQAPTAASLDPLRVDFDRPLDRALLEHCLQIVDERGNAVEGRIEVGVGEQSWALHPDDPWSAGTHQVVVRAILEDIAGNSVARVFDRDLALVDHTPRDVEYVVLAFEPG